MWRQLEKGYTRKISRGTGTKTRNFKNFYVVILHIIMYILDFFLTSVGNKKSVLIGALLNFHRLWRAGDTSHPVVSMSSSWILLGYALTGTKVLS